MQRFGVGLAAGIVASGIMGLVSGERMMAGGLIGAGLGSLIGYVWFEWRDIKRIRSERKWILELMKRYDDQGRLTPLHEAEKGAEKGEAT